MEIIDFSLFNLFHISSEENVIIYYLIIGVLSSGPGALEFMIMNAIPPGRTL
jgi:hypothetical protein